jgi:hypothetical protein
MYGMLAKLKFKNEVKLKFENEVSS